MIVKNEAHIIAGTLEHLLKYFTFDYWVISDTGSTDNTKELIVEFFKKHNIPGELVEHPWEDFGTNRTKAFECAYNKTDYAFVWDADDEVSGDFKMPENLTHDSYKFIFGNYDGFRYSRHQLFNNRKRWCYRGVLHEYAACLEDRGPDGNVLGPYYFISGRRGDRSKDPQKYYKDALVLEKAIEKAAATGDQLINRYTFYCAQSYNSCNMHEKAIEFYKKCLTMDVWVQEKYVCCFEIYDQYEMLKRPSEGLQYLVESYKYDTTRVECIYRLVKYYCIHGPVDVAYAYYTLIQPYFENHYNPATLSDKLFAKKAEYDFYLPYYMAIVAERTKHHDVMAKMYVHVFKNKFLVGEWWIRNFIFNMQFCIRQLPKTLDFLESMLSYIEVAKGERITFEDQHNQIIGRAIDQYRDLLAAPSGRSIPPTISTKPRVMLTVTTCKRLDLFTKTVNSILNMWTDVDQIDYFYCVDDNSSEEDRVAMQTQYPFFNYYMKSASERGHRESMNLIWSKLNELKPTYWIHLEDDWLFFKKEAYVTRAIQALETHESKQVHQVVFNRNYGLMYSDLERTGGLPLGPGLILHEKRDGIPGRNCGYWPHYSLQPSVTRTKVVLELGNYDSPNKFFERDYADRYHARGYMTAFFNSIYSIHIGKQHWEKDGKNAYALNEVAQFNGGSSLEQGDSTSVTITQVNESLPLTGTMKAHLESVLDKIRNKVPFGLIRPSDGERSVMLGETLTNCDKWTFTKGGTLQADLLSAVQTVDPNLYIGIPCNTCCKPWNCTPAIYKDFMEAFKVPLAQRTYANIFMNSNWATFSEFIKSYTDRFFLVTSGTTISDLPIKERYIISDKLVDTWDADGAQETERLLKFIESKKGELILFSAGPLSKVWIPKCMKANPTNMYIDVGSSLDLYTKGQANRLYTDPTHPFSKETCVFSNISKRNLVYFTVFNNTGYADLLEILMTTMKFYSNLENIDFLVFTSPSLKGRINEISTKLDIKIQIQIFNFTAWHDALCARIRIFDYPDTDKYDKILYLDTDIVVQNDISVLFAQDIEDKVYAIKEGTIEHEYHGGNFFDFTTIDKDITGMNSGILLFKPTKDILQTFRNAHEHMCNIWIQNKQMPTCSDQALINYHFIKANKHQTGFLEKYGLIYCDSKYFIPPPPPSAPTDIILCHFVTPLGDAEGKKQRMIKHVAHILNHYKNIHGSSKFLNSDILPLVMRKQYTWEGGRVFFEKKGILITTWSRTGTYEILNSHVVKASWSGFEHALIFNKTYTRFISIRISDCMISRHEIDTSLCDLIPIPSALKNHIVTGSKNLLYFCIFHNKGYFELLELLLSTLLLQSNLSSIDLLVLTSANYVSLIQTMSTKLNLTIDIHLCNFTTQHEAGCARLSIFEYSKISQYSKILYMDCDIIVQGDLSKLFALPIEDKVYAKQEYAVGGEGHGGWFFDFNTIDETTPAINSGILLFPNSAKICAVFKDIQVHIQSARASKALLPLCMDQSFIVYHLYKNDLYNNQLISPYIYLAEFTQPPVINKDELMLAHFVWPIGNTAHKKDRMMQHIKQIVA